MREFWFAIIPHTAHVNLQLADGVELPNPDGRIEGTGKRVRHIKIRSEDDACSVPVRRADRGPGVGPPLTAAHLGAPRHDSLLLG